MSKNSTLKVVGHYLIFYVIGIVAAITVTSIEIILLKTSMLLYYPIFSVPGYFLFYFYLGAPYTSGYDFGYMVLYALGLSPVLASTAYYFLRAKRLKKLLPLLIAFPIGFVGAIGIYFTFASSV